MRVISGFDDFFRQGIGENAFLVVRQNNAIEARRKLLMQPVEKDFFFLFG